MSFADYFNARSIIYIWRAHLLARAPCCCLSVGDPGYFKANSLTQGDKDLAYFWCSS